MVGVIFKGANQMSTLNYIDENGNINKTGCIPKNYPASNIQMANGESVEETISTLKSGTITLPYQSQYYCQKDITVPSGAKVVANFVFGIGAYNKTSGVMINNLSDTTARIIAYASGGSFVSGDSVDVNYICF